MHPILDKVIASFYKLPLTAIPLRYLDSVNWPLALSRLEFVVILLVVLWLLRAIFCFTARIIHHRKTPTVFLEVIPPRETSAGAASTAGLFTLISGLLSQRSVADRLLFRQASASFEIVSEKESGIGFIIRVPVSLAEPLSKSLRSYLPGLKVQETTDYLPKDFKSKTAKLKIIQFRLTKRFALPLNEQASLQTHDPLAYLTGNMTQLKNDDLLALQLILEPLTGSGHSKERRAVGRILGLIHYNRFANWVRYTSSQKAVLFLAIGIEQLARLITMPFLVIANAIQGYEAKLPERPKTLTATTAELELAAEVEQKLKQPLFAVTVRALIFVEKEKFLTREKGLKSSFVSFNHSCGQALAPEWSWYSQLLRPLRLREFRSRFSLSKLVLSASEVAALYHFPLSATTETEDLVRVKSRELPAPLSLKNNQSLDVVFGTNTYGNTKTLIGLTDEDRSRHMYLIGQTGSGKTTVIYHMASDDIRRGRGVAVIDPHGDLAADLLGSIPAERTDDLVYFNPYDIGYPVGLNLLELAPTKTKDELELEKELVCESVISIFRRVFSKDEHTDAHRIEYVLRNAIHTAFTVPDCTIFTVYELLDNPEYRTSVVKNLTDHNLKNFWKNEFGKAGNYQIVKMVSGVTAKVGRFLFSPVAKRILEQPKSTINFEEIIDCKKILLCNLAEGKIGEDTSQLLGTTVIAKIQQAAVRRVRQELQSRTPFYLFVDEFQNFATSSFTKLLSGGRKFGLRVTIAEQSTSQQDNRNTVNVILANTGTVVCFRTASPVDEELMLAQFAPHIEQGDIMNLPRYRFYIKLSAVAPEAPFSGETLPMMPQKDPERLAELIAASRKNYATEYKEPPEPKKVTPTPDEKPSKNPTAKKESHAKPPVK
ncbi:type IV secretion system DNA-binding domain-containing protein, partial [Patescibacteria group bacterium]|nr:type IV secretion system DNA-binding domain-containing protein [Patescibacteria group bacterium]